MKPVLDLVTKLGPPRIAAMCAVALALIGFFTFVILRASKPDLGVLFADLSVQDSAAVIRDLDSRGIPYETRGTAGQTILAPRADVARLRMDLAGKGVPMQGGIGYEIFDKGDSFTSTGFVQNVNHLRAMEGELARSIRAIGQVQAARVHLVMPERRLFQRDREAPSAAIMLKLSGDLDPSQVHAIRHLAASSVEGLKPERVSIVDERGRLLADGARGADAEAAYGYEEKQAGLERRLRAQIEEIVAGVVGQGRARVQVTAELDRNRIESRSETFDPESRVVRSNQTRTENSLTGGAEGQVSIGNELPGANQQSGAAPAQKDTSQKNEETTNYEISRVTKTEVTEGGRLKRLSVAVLVDGVYVPGADGKSTYQPRPSADIDRIGALVRSAIGFDKARGDQIEVANLRFADAPAMPEFQEQGLIQSLLSPTKEDIMRAIELTVLSLLTLIVVLVVVRPLVKRVLEADVIPVVEGPALATAGADIMPELVKPENKTAQYLEYAKLNGQIQAETVERVVDMVRASPTETVEVLRNWIHDN